MSKFNYCHSLDELKWNINPESEYIVYMLNNKLEKGNRFKIKEWISEHCDEHVYCWNMCSTPDKGELNYEFKLAPCGDSILYFGSETDFNMFIDQWNSIIDYVGHGFSSANYVKLKTYIESRAMASSASYISIPRINEKIIWAKNNYPKSYPLCKIKYDLPTDKIHIDIGIEFDMAGHQAHFIYTFTDLFEEF